MEKSKHSSLDEWKVAEPEAYENAVTQNLLPKICKTFRWELPTEWRNMKTEKKILDACCGSRMFWFDKKNPDVLYGDIRNEEHTLSDGRDVKIRPDIVMDFRDMPFADNTFKMVVFDPPHLNKLGKASWMGKKYGVLSSTWENDIKQGFDECMRVLEPNGVLIFKWSEHQIKSSQILSIIPYKPLFGHTTGRQAKTIWMAFMKFDKEAELRMVA